MRRAIGRTSQYSKVCSANVLMVFERPLSTAADAEGDGAGIGELM